MAGTTTTKVKFYVTTLQDCTDCGGQGSAYAGPPCPTCRGTGTLEDAVELTTALASLGILTRLEQVERTASRAMQYADGLANGGI
jgi:DnaJ-class molecular chaperone